MRCRARLAPLAAQLAVACAAAACASRLPTPPTGPHVDDVPVLVPHPPPPAKVEVIPPAPSDEEVWIDGEWRWQGRRWVWQGGAWERPYPGAHYAPATLVRRADGSLAWFAGAWQFGRNR